MPRPYTEEEVKDTITLIDEWLTVFPRDKDRKALEEQKAILKRSIYHE